MHARITLYNSLVVPLFDYSDHDIIWGDKNNEVLMGNLQTLQSTVTKVILDSPISSSATNCSKCFRFYITMLW